MEGSAVELADRTYRERDAIPWGPIIWNATVEAVGLIGGSGQDDIDHSVGVADEAIGPHRVLGRDQSELQPTAGLHASNGQRVQTMGCGHR